jgi:CelD/BcsL family acetyltransferase involved in cellulose biosynthesis
MRVSVIKGNELSAEHLGAWSAIQASVPELESPFFCPEFTQAFAQVHENVFVGILQDQKGAPAGFFPFELLRPGFGKNLEMCDYQGVIAPRHLKIDAKELVRSCGLRVWEFDHLISANHAFRRFYSYTAESPIIDVSQGFEAYKASLSPEGKRHLAKAAASARKVQREIGALAFVYNTTDSQVIEAMHGWRAQKYGPLPGWAHEALERLRTTHTPAFAGVLSALYAGEKLIAVHFGIRSRAVLHWWLPAYNPELPSYAPGILLLLAMAERSPALGITKIDLGKGLQDYKRRFRNASATVATGSVDVLSLTTVPRIIRRTCLNYVRNSPELLNLARRAKGIIYKIRPAFA